MCQIIYDQFRYQARRRASDIARCHAYHQLREKTSATYQDYENAVKEAFGGYGSGFSSVIRCLIGNSYHLDHEKIIGWRFSEEPIFQDFANLFSYSKASILREKCIDMWNTAADQDEAVYSSLEKMDVCLVCGNGYAPHLSVGCDPNNLAWRIHKTPSWANLPTLSNETRYGTCMRKACRKVAEASEKLGYTRTPYRGSKTPYTLFLLNEAVKHGGNNEIYRWLKKNAFRDAGKVLQRGDRCDSSQNSGKSIRLDSQKCSH
jgi:hypothetical protein